MKTLKTTLMLIFALLMFGTASAATTFDISPKTVVYCDSGLEYWKDIQYPRYYRTHTRYNGTTSIMIRGVIKGSVFTYRVECDISTLDALN